MKKALEFDKPMDPALEQEIINWEFNRTFARLLESLVPVPGCSDRYVIYSEREQMIVVASMNPAKADGAFTVVKVNPDGFKKFPSWKMPGIVVTALRGYLGKFLEDIKSRANVI